MPRFSFRRLLAHLLHTPLTTRRAFSPAVQKRLHDAIAASERHHHGEIRFVVEGDWPLWQVLRGKTPRERALELFGLMNVWDTEDNSGLLVYVLLCERHVEILADRGLNTLVEKDLWESVCREMSTAFREGFYEAGSLEALETLNGLLSRFFPAQGDNPNELPDWPIVLR